MANLDERLWGIGGLCEVVSYETKDMSSLKDLLHVLYARQRRCAALAAVQQIYDPRTEGDEIMAVSMMVAAGAWPIQGEEGCSWWERTWFSMDVFHDGNVPSEAFALLNGGRLCDGAVNCRVYKYAGEALLDLVDALAALIRNRRTALHAKKHPAPASMLNEEAIASDR